MINRGLPQEAEKRYLEFITARISPGEKPIPEVLVTTASFPESPQPMLRALIAPDEYLDSG